MPTPAITLREATTADHPVLRTFNDRLISEASLPGATREDFARFQTSFTDAVLTNTDPNTKLIVAVDEADTIQGYIHLQPAKDDVLQRDIGYVSIIAVAESAAGQGTGRQLMQAAEEWAKAQRYPALVLDVFASNVGARRFYKGRGFNDDSVRLRKSLT